MYFCLHCFTGEENKAKELITKYLSQNIQEDYKIWFPVKHCKERKKGKFINVGRPMFNGYLFIWWDGEEEKYFPFSDIQKIPGVMRFLTYDNGQKSLIGQDLNFVNWINSNSGTIKESKVLITEGRKVHFVEGPLVGFDGNVVKLDRHHKKVTVRFELDSNIVDIGFSVEFIERNLSIENLTT